MQVRIRSTPWPLSLTVGAGGGPTARLAIFPFWLPATTLHARLALAPTEQTMLAHSPTTPSSTHLQVAEILAGGGVEGGHHLREVAAPAALRVPCLGRRHHLVVHHPQPQPHLPDHALDGAQLRGGGRCWGTCC